MVITEDNEDDPTSDSGWINRIEETLATCSDDWGLQIGQALRSGLVGYLVEVTRSDGTAAVLKLREPGRLMRAEAEALKFFNGSGAARLFEADYGLGALLMERVTPGDTLVDRAGDVDADAAVASVMPQLWGAPGDIELRNVKEQADRWATGLEERHDNVPVERDRLVWAAKTLRELADTQGELSVLHGDLHVEGVLVADRAPFLAIDPKGFVGESTFDAGWWLRDPPRSDPGDAKALRRRLDVLVSEAGVDRERTLLWAKGCVAVVTASRYRAEMFADARRHEFCMNAFDSID